MSLVPQHACQAVAHLIGVLDALLGSWAGKTVGPVVHSVPVKTPAGPGEGVARRSPNCGDRELGACLDLDIGTMAELLDRSARRYPHRLAFGWRAPVTRPPDKSRLPAGVTVMGRARYVTYLQFQEQVHAIGRGLRAQGLGPGDIVAFHEDTCLEWLLLAHAAWQNGMVITTIYANLGDAALQFALIQTKAKAILTTRANVPPLAESSTLPELRLILHRNQLEEQVPSRKIVLSLADLEASGAHQSLSRVTPAPDDVACIMYTSGTTGNPKGVLLSHRNMVVGIAAMVDRIGLGRDMEGQVTVAFLPLAHVYSLVIVHSVIFGGGLIGLGLPTTLTDATTEPHGDLKEFRPHMLCSVPRVFDLFRKAAEAQVAKASPVSRALFHAAYEYRRRAMLVGRSTPLWDWLVFRRVRQAFGGRFRVAFSGGAPVSERTQEFMRVVLGLEIGQGYGLTETTACLAVQLRGDVSSGNVGAVHDPCEVKLVDLPEMGYTSKDKPCPRGEVVVRGPNVSRGYYELPDLTAEVFLEGGWFATGDIGMWLPSGALKLIDRKKNLVKLGMGEYVALERLETIYSNCRFVMPNGICCVAHTDKMYIGAVILVNQDAVRAVAKEHGWNLDWAELLQSPQLRRVVQEALKQEAEANQLKPFEHVKRFKLYDDVWTVESGLLTPAMKLVRRKVEEHYKADIATLFA